VFSSGQPVMPLNVATGNVLEQTHRRHRSVEFRQFLDLIDASVPRDSAVHLVIDNDATHKSPLKTPIYQRCLCYRRLGSEGQSDYISEIVLGADVVGRIDAEGPRRKGRRR